MEGGTLLAAWRSFRETLPEQVRNSGVVRLAFAAGASWATERMTDQREKVRHDALVMIGKAEADMPANVEFRPLDAASSRPVAPATKGYTAPTECDGGQT